MKKTAIRASAAALTLSSTLMMASSAQAQDPPRSNVALPAPQRADAASPAAQKPNPGPHQGTLGVSLGLPAGGAPTFGLSYGVADDASIRADVGLDISSMSAPPAAGAGLVAKSDPESKVLLGFSLDVGYRMYLWQSGSLHAFVQPGIFFSKRAEAGDFGALSTVAAVGGVGAEYFFVDQLSVAGATGASLSLANDFKDVRFSTGTTGLYANFYW